MIRKKVCMLGAYAVGKTSLVRRQVSDTFSDAYQTTIGVKITKQELAIAGKDMTLLLWDLHGDDEFQTVQDSYLRGSSGLLVVLDATRSDTLDKAEQLLARAQALLGTLPTLLLANKSDLEANWETGPPLANRFPDQTLIKTSAKTGEGVRDAFEELCTRMLEHS